VFGTTLSSAHYLKKFDEMLLIGNYSGFEKYDIKTEQLTHLLSKQSSSYPSKWFKRFEFENNTDRFIPVDGDLLCHNGSKLFFFHEGEKEPEYLESYSRDDSSSSPVIRDIILTKKGLWVLTDDALYLILEIVEHKSGKILSQTMHP
jgi:hypothetical protein